MDRIESARSENSCHVFCSEGHMLEACSRCEVEQIHVGLHAARCYALKLAICVP
jgi:hypothetical protein